MEWIGYALDMRRFRMGGSELRAFWARRRLLDKAAEGRARRGVLREGLGRHQFIAGPIEYRWPCLAPLYARASVVPKFAGPRLLVVIVLIL